MARLRHRAAAPRKLARVSAALLAASLVGSAQAEDGIESSDASKGGILPVPDYSGDLWERSYLFGDLAGSRAALADRGVQLQIDWTQTLQSVLDGGVKTDTHYGGSLDFLLNLDFDRMGVIPGGLLKIRGESRYGNSVNDIAGQILSASTDGLVPLSDELDEDIEITLTTLAYTQFLSESFGVVLGKFDNFDSDFNEFASGRGTSQFLNSNFIFTPVTLTEPYSTLGAGLIWMPSEHVTATTFVYNLADASTSTGFGDFGDGWTWFAELYLQYQLCNLPGGMVFGGLHNFDAEFDEIGSARFVVGRDGPMLATRSVNDAWSVYWNGWQYLWTADPVDGPVNLEDGEADHRGIGVFMRTGLADTDANPIEWTISGGLGGRGQLPGRDADTLGVGLFYTGVKETRLANLLGVDDHSQGLEAFYNAEVTPATRLTADVQVLDSALSRIDTAVIVGLRLSLRF